MIILTLKERFIAEWNASMETQITPQDFYKFKDEYIEWLEERVRDKERLAV
jgi:hypothetical protein